MYHHKTLNVIPRHVYLCTVTGIKVIDRMAGDGKKIIFPLLLKIEWSLWLGYYTSSNKQLFVREMEATTGKFFLIIITIIIIWLFCPIAQFPYFFF